MANNFWGAHCTAIRPDAKGNQFAVYKVNEIFETIQGEGSYTGTPAIFVRLQGCPVGCAWCDTKHTWDIEPALLIALSDTSTKKAESDHWASASADDLLALFNGRGYRARHVVVTGGGPGNSTTFLSIDLVKMAVGQFDLGPAAAMSIIYFLIILALSWVFYTVMTNSDAKG